MKSVQALIFVLLTFSGILYTCTEVQNTEGDKIENAITEIAVKSTEASDNKVEGVSKVFYNLPSPIEMSQVVKNSNAGFYPDLLNPTLKADQYNTQKSMALNIGVYGVDLGYAKIFDQVQLSLQYLDVVNQLSHKLGLPENKAKEIYHTFETNIGDTEAQLELLAETYSNANLYLKENDRQNVATLIMLGGWLEGLYIATELYKRDNSNLYLLSRIAEQKFSLKTIIELMSEVQNEPVFSQYLTRLLLLKKIFDGVQIQFDKNEAKLDTINKVLIYSSGHSNVVASQKQIDDISMIISYMRNKIVE